MNKLMKAGLLATLVLALVFVGIYAADDKSGVIHISQQELVEKAKDPNTVLIDIRTQQEVDQGVIPGSVHIPITKIMQDTSLLDGYAGKDLVFYCHSGVRVKRLTDYLQRVEHSSKGKLHHLEGDMSAWRANGNPIEIKSPAE